MMILLLRSGRAGGWNTAVKVEASVTVEAIVGLGSTVAAGVCSGVGEGVKLDGGAIWAGICRGTRVGVVTGSIMDVDVGVCVALAGATGVGVWVAPGWAQAANNTAPKSKMKRLPETFGMPQIVPDLAALGSVGQEMTLQGMVTQPVLHTCRRNLVVHQGDDL